VATRGTGGKPSASAQFDLFGTYRLVLDTDGRVESEDWKLIPLQGTAQSGWYGWVQINPSYERLTSPYEIVPGVVLPRGEYRFANADAGLTSAQSRACWVSLEREKPAPSTTATTRFPIPPSTFPRSTAA